MPVLPVSMLGFLDAPVPFLLGVQYKTSDIMARCVGHIRVNVYKVCVEGVGRCARVQVVSKSERLWHCCGRRRPTTSKNVTGVLNE